MRANAGTIGAFRWIESVLPETLGIADALYRLRGYVLGLRAVNVSWDSGLLAPSNEEQRNGWTVLGNRALSPPIDNAVIEGWPFCDEGYEEWYFFRSLPSHVQFSAYCNWLGLRLSEWEKIVEAVPSGFNLKQQLEESRPDLVLGIGRTFFAICPRPEPIDEIHSWLSTV